MSTLANFYVDPSNLVYSNNLFSETIVPVLKLHMQYDQTAELQNDQIQPDRESKMTAVTNNNKTN